MQAHGVLRRAAAIIEAGWSSGAVARDGSGRPVPLFKGDAKAGINPDAVAFSIYGAVCKATHEAGRVERLPLVWDVLFRHARAGSEGGEGIPHGGTNHVHPIMQFNEHPGRTVDEVLALLEVAAQDCEQIGDGTFPPPVTANPNVLAAL